MRLIDADALMEELSARKMSEIYPIWRMMPYEEREQIMRLANAFRGAIINAPEVMPKAGWINVKDGLPQETGIYIVYDGDDVMPAFHLQGAWMWENGDAMYGVTHWQPMPEPPEVECAACRIDFDGEGKNGAR